MLLVDDVLLFGVGVRVVLGVALLSLGRSDLSSLQSLPVDILEEGVFLDGGVVSLGSQSLLRISLKQSLRFPWGTFKRFLASELMLGGYFRIPSLMS